MLPDHFAAKFDVSRETMERLSIYERLLKEWGQTLSLVSRSTLDDVWNRHFADSAQIAKLVGGSVLDMGTGAGFPGMVLAIMGHHDIHLSDNNQKKVEFLHAVAAQTSTKVMIHNCKAEAVPDLGFGTITARGLMPLDDLLTISARLSRPDTRCVFLKGKSHLTEIEAARRHWNFACIATPSVTSDEAAILTITKLEKRKAA